MIETDAMFQWRRGLDGTSLMGLVGGAGFAKPASQSDMGVSLLSPD